MKYMCYHRWLIIHMKVDRFFQFFSSFWVQTVCCWLVIGQSTFEKKLTNYWEKRNKNEGRIGNKRNTVLIYKSKIQRKIQGDATENKSEGKKHVIKLKSIIVHKNTS